MLSIHWSLAIPTTLYALYRFGVLVLAWRALELTGDASSITHVSTLLRRSERGHDEGD